jgi:hypothetical protein
MSHKNNTKPQSKTTTVRPQVTSYDSGHEHSIEHWIEVRVMVEEFEEETVVIAKPQALAAKA